MNPLSEIRLHIEDNQHKIPSQIETQLGVLQHGHSRATLKVTFGEIASHLQRAPQFP